MAQGVKQVMNYRVAVVEEDKTLKYIVVPDGQAGALHGLSSTINVLL